MPPKPIISAGKGQQSLFSFFNKPAVQVSAEKNEVKEPKSMAPQTPSASSILQGVETANEFKSATTRDVVSLFLQYSIYKYFLSCRHYHSYPPFYIYLFS